MFEKFAKSYSVDRGLSVANATLGKVYGSEDFRDLFGKFGDCSFENGLYRIMREADVALWNARVIVGFPRFEGRIISFGYDWLGRVFAVDIKRFENNRPGVVMFEPGSGEALDIPCNLGSFHDMELIRYRNAALAADFYRSWLAKGGKPPRHDECVGYKKPLFLTGKDAVDNLEMATIDVYWHLFGQLVRQVKGIR